MDGNFGKDIHSQLVWTLVNGYFLKETHGWPL